MKQIRTASDSARSTGKRPADVEQASFAVVGWLDEVVARFPEWWGGATPLQISLFQTNNAGNEFFGKLDALGSDQDEVRDVYYVALCLGFLGQYVFDSSESGELGRIKDQCARHLSIRPISPSALLQERFFPRLYPANVPSPKLPGRLDDLVLKGALILAVLVPLVSILVAVFATGGKNEIQSNLTAFLAGVECSSLQGNVDESGVAHVKGFVPKPDDAVRVASGVREIPGVRDVDAQLSVRIWPYCAVVALLEPLRLRNDQGAYQLGVGLPAAKANVLLEGDRVVVEVKAPNYPAYVYVDYYTIDGTVIHMFPNPREPGSGKQFPAEATVRAGEKIEPPWQIAGPFGEEFITVIAAPTPLDLGNREEVEAARDYLSRLGAMVQRESGGSRTVATWSFVKTHAAEHQ
jgi:type IV/VI secretion system ImpK/VasF family protein